MSYQERQALIDAVEILKAGEVVEHKGYEYLIEAPERVQVLRDTHQVVIQYSAWFTDSTKNLGAWRTNRPETIWITC